MSFSAGIVQLNRDTNPNSLFVDFEDERAGCTSCCDALRSVWEQIKMMRGASKDYVPVNYVRARDGQYPEEELPWHTDSYSSGLCLFVHGLNSSPWCWQQYIKEIEISNETNNTQYHCFAPMVRRGGDCNLEEAVEPFRKVIDNYRAKFPHMPIYLIGASNGGRIVSMLDRYITCTETQVKVVSIAGVHFGSTTFDRLPQYFKRNLSPEVQSDLPYGAQPTKERLHGWRDFAVRNNHYYHRERLFFATTADTHVRPCTSSLPKIGGNDHHFIVHRETHCTITQRLRPFVLNRLGFSVGNS